jgi:hypothetical protein
MTQIDPMKLGQTQEWYRPDVFSATDWVPRDTHTSAMNQGLANYKDSIWYRCTVKVPQRFEGRKIMLFFAGLKRGDVWVNGKEIGNVQNHQPREIDVSEGLVFGAENHIVVRTKDHGVFRPSFLWSPPKK